MSLKQTIIDPVSAQTLTFFSKGATRDGSGNYTATETTIGTAVGDIQPVIVNDPLEITGGMATENAEAITHLAFVKERVTGVRAKDYIRDENGEEYIIVFVHDFRGVPQEFDLRKMSDED